MSIARDAADRNFEQGLDIVRRVISRLSCGAKGQSPVRTARATSSCGGLLLNGLIDAVFDKDLFEGLGVELVVELLGFELEFGLEDIDEAIDVVLQDFSGAHDLRAIVLVDQHQVS